MYRMLIVLVLVASFASADAVYKNSESVENAIWLGADGSDVLIEFNLQALDAKEIFTNGFGSGTEFSIPEECGSNDIGRPDLPILRKLVQIPATGGIRVEIVSDETTVLGLYSVAPFQGYPSRNGETQAWKIDETVYSTSAFYPSACVQLEAVEILRDIRVARVVFNPVRVNPVTGETIITTSVTIRLVNEGSGENELLRNVTAYTSSYMPIYEEVLGFDDNRDTTTGSYLVISSQEGYEYAQDLIDWKRQTGLEVHFGRVPDIGSTVSAIESYIDNAFNTWSNPPEWILIIGGEDVVPAPQGSGTTSDNRYGVIGSGYDPSIHVGRICGGDTDNLTYQTWKIQSYENDPYQPASSWFQEGVSIGSTDFQDPWMSYRYAQVMRTHEMTAALYCNSGSYGGVPPSITNLSAEFNDGTSLVSYIGHGDVTYWVTTGFSNGNVAALTNGRKLPWISSIACQNANFEGNYCFGEAWMAEGTIANPKGAVGFMGATTNSPVGPTDSLAMYQFRGYFQEEIYHMGAAFDYGKIKAYLYTGDSGNSDMHMIFGCPEFDIFTDTSPLVYLSGTHDAYISAGSYSVTVTAGGYPVAGAHVGIVQDTTLLAGGFTDASGVVSFTIGTIPTLDDVTVTCTNHNGYPYVGTAQVITGINSGQSGISGVLSLDRPYPNPISSSAVFTYSLPVSCNASLSVFDISGRTVCDLTDGDHTAGVHTVTWDGTDANGTSVPGGVYLYRLSTPNGVETQSCVVIR